MSAGVRPHTFPLGGRSGRPDRRKVVVAVSSGDWQSRRWPANVERLKHIQWANVGDGVAHQTRMQALFWADVLRGQSSVLLVCGDIDRDMAMVGPPPQTWTPTANWRHASGAEYRYRHNRRSLTVISASNWHPEGVYAGGLEFWPLYDWIEDYVDFVRSKGLGPKLYPTLGQQSLHSYRLMVEDERHRLQWHRCESLHRFESQVRAAQSPVRIRPEDGYHRKLYYLDYTAHYLGVLIDYQLPQEPLGWYRDGSSVGHVRHLLRSGQAVIADVETDNGRHLWTTPDLMKCSNDIKAVHRMAHYRATHTLRAWAERMYWLRERAPDHLRPTIKGLGVMLWGKLGQKNYTFVPAEDETDNPEPEMLYGLGPISCGDVTYQYDCEGNYTECDPHGLERERFHALAAHVIAYGRDRLLQWATGDNEIVYAHTDSLWTTKPIVGTAAAGRGVGTPKQAIRRDVEWRDGIRYVAGKPDARPGVARSNTRHYHPFDAWDAPPSGRAVFEMRQ